MARTVPSAVQRKTHRMTWAGGNPLIAWNILRSPHSPFKDLGRLYPIICVPLSQTGSQTLLLPESLDDYVGAENPVRFIEAFVDGLDLTTAGFIRVAPKRTGRPGYDPADLLKLYIYGYLNRVRSSRRLEAETHRHIEVIWLLRHLKPDFKTIADFRRDNRKAFRPIFRQFVLLCRQMDLFGKELLAVDGTRIKAVNNKDRNFTRASLTKFVELADTK